MIFYDIDNQYVVNLWLKQVPKRAITWLFLVPVLTIWVL